MCGLLDLAADFGQSVGAPDQERADRAAVGGERGGEVACVWVAVDPDVVGAMRVAEVLDADAVLVAPEARCGRWRHVEAEHRACGGGALAGGCLPVFGPGVGAELRVEVLGGVACRVDAGDRGVPSRVNWYAAVVEAAAGEPLGRRDGADADEHDVAIDAVTIVELDRVDGVV